jgi:hypothetical protein
LYKRSSLGLVNASQIADQDARFLALQDLISRSNYLFDILMTFFSHDEPSLCNLAAEVYIHKAYVAFEIKGVRVKQAETLQDSGKLVRIGLQVRTHTCLENE